MRNKEVKNRLLVYVSVIALLAVALLGCAKAEEMPIAQPQYNIPTQAELCEGLSGNTFRVVDVNPDPNAADVMICASSDLEGVYIRALIAPLTPTLPEVKEVGPIVPGKTEYMSYVGDPAYYAVTRLNGLEVENSCVSQDDSGVYVCKSKPLGGST